MTVRKARRSAVAIASFVIGSMLVRSAAADEASDTATARALGIEGVSLANAGNCKDAIERLDRAEKLHHAPTTATRLAECEIEVGKIVRGTERLQRVIREPLAANAHPAFGAAVTRAHKVLESALPRLSTVKITVEAPGRVSFSAWIDDEPMSDAAIDTPRAIDPGAHVIRVAAEGYRTSVVNESLEEGQTKTVTVVLERDPRAERTRSAILGQPTAFRVQQQRSKWPAAVAFGVGALGLGAGVVGAVMVERKANALDASCDANRVCPPENGGDIREAKTWATVSTAGFVTAGVGVALGVVLLATTAKVDEAPRTGLRMRPRVSVSSVGLDGTF